MTGRYNIAKPYLNINGSSKEDLLALNVKALEKLKSAVEALRDAQPHGRDFPDDYGAQALREHEARCDVLTHIIDEVEDICIAIQEQGK